MIGFLKVAFGGKESVHMMRSDGTVWHAEVKIGDSILMIGEPMKEFGPMPSSLYLYVKDCDAVYRRALRAGGKSVMEPVSQPTGERYGGVRDPSGNIWWIATHVADVSVKDQVKLSKSLAKRQRRRRASG